MGEVVLTAMITSTTTVAILAYLVKIYFDKLLGIHFKEKETVIDRKSSLHAHLSQSILDGRLGIYPELCEIIYRLNKSMKSAVEAESIVQWDLNLPQLSATLTEQLFQGQFYFSDELFELLHEYKRIAQDAANMYDLLTRPDNIHNKDLYRECHNDLINKVCRVDALYNDILSLIKQRIKLLADLND